MSYYGEKILESLMKALEVLSVKRGDETHEELDRDSAEPRRTKTQESLVRPDDKELKMHRAMHQQSTTRHH